MSYPKPNPVASKRMRMIARLIKANPSITQKEAMRMSLSNLRRAIQASKNVRFDETYGMGPTKSQNSVSPSTTQELSDKVQRLLNELDSGLSDIDLTPFQHHAICSYVTEITKTLTELRMR